MTTIAWDGKSLSGDGLVVEDKDVIFQTDFEKVRRIHGNKKLHATGEILVAYGLAGDADAFGVLESWLLKGTNIWHDNLDISAIIVTVESVYSLTSDTCGRLFLCTGVVAIGSGSREALVAMRLGKSSRQAVKVACDNLITSDGKITTIKCR